MPRLVSLPWNRQPQEFIRTAPAGVAVAWHGQTFAVGESEERNSLVFSGVSTGVGPAGAAWVVPAGTGNSVTFGSNTALCLPGPLTLVSAYAITATPSGTSRIAGTLFGAASGFAIAPSATNYRAATSNGAAATFITGGAIVLGQVNVDVLRIVGDSGTRQVSYWQNGVLVGTSSVTYAPFGDAACRFRIGRDNASITAAGHSNFGGALLSRAIADAEAEALKTPADLWRWLFQPRRIWVPVTAAGGYTLALDAGTYALTGAAATLTVGRKLAAAAGSYAVSGSVGGLRVDRALMPASGVYTVDGKTTTLTYSGATVIPTMPPYITTYFWKRTA